MKLKIYDDDRPNEYYPTEYCVLDPNRTNAYESWIKDNVKDKTFIDLGAGSGVLCYQALKYGAKKVYAFEGNSRLIGDLKDTFKDNKEVEVVYGNFEHDPIPECDIYVHEMIAHNIVSEGLSVLFARAEYEGFADHLTPFDIEVWNCIPETYDMIDEPVDTNNFMPATKEFLENVVPVYTEQFYKGHIYHVDLKEKIFHGHMKDLKHEMFLKPEYAGTKNRIAWKVNFPNGASYQNFNSETQWNLGEYWKENPMYSYDPEESIRARQK